MSEAVRVDLRDLLAFLKAYANGLLTGGQVQRQFNWPIKKACQLRRYCLDEGLLELDHVAPEEPWHHKASNYHRLTTKGRRLLQATED